MKSSSKKRLLLNIGLLVIVAGLIGFIVSRDADETESYKTLYDDSIGDNAKELVIHVKGKDDLIIQLRDDIWYVVKPSNFKADKDKVRHLFTLLSENAESNYGIEGKDLASYGLDTEDLSISFNGVKMIFGKRNIVTGKRYILKGERMYLISETISGLMMLGEEGFRYQEKPELIPVPVGKN